MKNDDFKESLEDLPEEELVQILDRGKLTEEEFDILVEAMESKGLSGQIMEIEGDPSDDQGAQLIEYLSYHKKMSKFKNDIDEDKEVKKAIKSLKNKASLLEEKKIAIMILAHSGRIDALNVLKKFADKSEKELTYWAITAIGECKMFLESKLTDKPRVRISKLKKK
jgi:hypothetical protein